MKWLRALIRNVTIRSLTAVRTSCHDEAREKEVPLRQGVRQNSSAIDVVATEWSVSSGGRVLFFSPKGFHQLSESANRNNLEKVVAARAVPHRVAMGGLAVRELFQRLQRSFRSRFGTQGRSDSIGPLLG
jgi:hypothetical protein